MKRWRSVGLATVSGLVETVGAVVGVVGWGMGFAAGVMSQVTIDELVPTAHDYCSGDHHHMVSTGLLVGMVLGMVLGLVLHI